MWVSFHSSYVRFDILQRILTRLFGITVIHAMVITDVDDKIIKRSWEVFTLHIPNMCYHVALILFLCFIHIYLSLVYRRMFLQTCWLQSMRMNSRGICFL